MDKAYSTNDEEYNFCEAGDALDALDSEGRLVEGAIYYEVDTERVNLAEFMKADHILERAEELLYDEIGEAAEDAFLVRDEATDELNALLKAWVAKQLAGTNVWRCVGKSRELRVTAEDVAEHAR